MMIPPRISGATFKRLVGALSALAAEGKLTQLRRAAPVRNTSAVVTPPKRFPSNETAILADAQVSGTPPPPGV